MLVAGERRWAVLRDVLAGLHHPGGNWLFDVRTAALMREHGVRGIDTAGADFLQFRDSRVVNPLSR